jgi:hypothetical protein
MQKEGNGEISAKPMSDQDAHTTVMQFWASLNTSQQHLKYIMDRERAPGGHHPPVSADLANIVAALSETNKALNALSLLVADLGLQVKPVEEE